MRVLTVYAHPDPQLCCHAVLEEFTRGLRDGGHEPDVLDLYALQFDPVFTEADMATWLHPDLPPEIPPRWPSSLPSSGWAIRRFSRAGSSGSPATATPSRSTGPGGPGKVSGRIGLLHHRKALVITPTLVSEEDHDAHRREPMTRILDDWGLRYPGVKQVEHVHFHWAAVADPETMRSNLARAYRLGRDFTPAPTTGDHAHSTDE